MTSAYFGIPKATNNIDLKPATGDYFAKSAFVCALSCTLVRRSLAAPKTSQYQLHSSPMRHGYIKEHDMIGSASRPTSSPKSSSGRHSGSAAPQRTDQSFYLAPK
jgi:hypothetical protein